jgi:hypothetical protein
LGLPHSKLEFYPDPHDRFVHPRLEEKVTTASPASTFEEYQSYKQE